MESISLALLLVIVVAGIIIVGPLVGPISNLLNSQAALNRARARAELVKVGIDDE